MTLGFDRIQRPATLSQEIVDAIERSIVARDLAAGTKLPTEQELCAMFSVSRTVVREALRMLSARGLVTIRKRSGIFVNELSSRDAASGIGLYLALHFDKDYILHYFNVRQAVEPLICRWAAEHRSPSSIWEMEKNLLRLEDCGPEDQEGAHALDLEFHQMLAAATKNPLVPLMMHPVYALMPRIRAIVAAHVPDPGMVLEQHRRILMAVRQRNEDAACREMQHHISTAAQMAYEALDAMNAAQAPPAGPDAPPPAPAPGVQTVHP